MNALRDLVRRQRELERERAALAKATTRYALFVWRGDGRYSASDAVGGKLYASQKVAERAANRSYEAYRAGKLAEPYVVRDVRVGDALP